MPCDVPASPASTASDPASVIDVTSAAAASPASTASDAASVIDVTSAAAAASPESTVPTSMEMSAKLASLRESAGGRDVMFARRTNGHGGLSPHGPIITAQAQDSGHFLGQPTDFLTTGAS